MSEEQAQYEIVEQTEVVTWSFDDLRIMLNQLLHEARLRGLKIDEVLAAVDITAKNLQVQYEMAVVEMINADRERAFAEQLDRDAEVPEPEEGC